MRVILMCTFLGASILSNAQFVKGDRFIEGAFSISVQRSTGENNLEGTSNSCSISPSVGIFLNEKYAVGGGLSYSVSQNKLEFDPDYYQKNRINSVGVSAFAARYFMISDKFFFKMTGRLYYSRDHQTQANGSSEYKTKLYAIGLDVGPSLLFFPSSNWGIEAGIGSFGVRQSRSLSDESKGISANLDYGSFYLGFAYYFREPWD